MWGMLAGPGSLLQIVSLSLLSPVIWQKFRALHAMESEMLLPSPKGQSRSCMLASAAELLRDD